MEKLLIEPETARVDIPPTISLISCRIVRNLRHGKLWRNDFSGLVFSQLNAWRRQLMYAREGGTLSYNEDVHAKKILLVILFGYF